MYYPKKLIPKKVLLLMADAPNARTDILDPAGIKTSLNPPPKGRMVKRVSAAAKPTYNPIYSPISSVISILLTSAELDATNCRGSDALPGMLVTAIFSSGPLGASIKNLGVSVKGLTGSGLGTLTGNGTKSDT
jgi:hypothetical protein